MSADNYLQKKLYRAGLIGGGVLFGIPLLDPVFAAISPFLPFIAAVLSGLITGFMFKSIFNFAVNKKLNQSYRHSAADATAADAAAADTPPKRQQRSAPPPREPPPPPPPPPDSRVMYRKILGLGERYTADELKAAYRDCAAKFHPDRYTNAGERERQRAEEMMKNINEAYHALLLNRE